MVQGIDPLNVALMVTATVTVLILFVPAFVELKRPKDKGPRSIINDSLASSIASTYRIDDVEEFKSHNVMWITRNNPFLSILNIENQF